jgi:hypothetical protein
MTQYDEGTQAEKKAILENEAKLRGQHPSHEAPKPTTYFELQRQQNERELAKPETKYPAQPPTSPWAGDPAGIEPPLGVAIDEQETTGTPAEVAKSLREKE